MNELQERLTTIYKKETLNFEISYERLREADEIRSLYKTCLENQSKNHTDLYKATYIRLEELQKERRIIAFAWGIKPKAGDSEQTKFEKEVMKYVGREYLEVEELRKELVEPNWSKGLSKTRIIKKLRGNQPDWYKKVSFSKDKRMKGYTDITPANSEYKVFVRVSKSPLPNNSIVNVFQDKEAGYKFVSKLPIQEMPNDLIKTCSEIKEFLEEHKDTIQLENESSTLVFGYDTEYDTRPDPDFYEKYNLSTPEERQKMATCDGLVSAQFSVLWEGYLVSFAFITKYAQTGNAKYRKEKHSFDKMLLFILKKLGFKTLKGKSNCERIKDSQRLEITLVSHNGIMDIPKLTYHNADTTEKELEKTENFLNCMNYMSTVQGGLCTIGNAIKYTVRDKINSRMEYLPIKINVKDSMCFTVGGKSLRAVGDTIAYPKLNIPPEAYLDMGKYYNCQPQNFLDYAVTDSEICVIYMGVLLGVNRKYGTTLMGISTMCIKDLEKKYILETMPMNELKNFAKKYNLKLKDKTGIMTDEFYMAYARGVRSRNEGKEKKGKSYSTEYFQKIKTVVPLNVYAEKALDFGAKCYAGGLNCSYVYGLYKEKSYDIDSIQCYGVGMQLLANIAIDEAPMEVVRNAFVNSMKDGWNKVWSIKNKEGNREKIDNFAFGLFIVDKVIFPKGLNRTTFGIHADGTILYPRTFVPPTDEDIILDDSIQDTYGYTAQIITGWELRLLLKLGGSCHIVEGCIYNTRKDKNGNIGRTFPKTMAELSKMREEAKKHYGKKHMVEQLVKLIVNSAYGKTGQGIRDKKTHNYITEESKQLEPSCISNPVLACFITSIGRTVLNAVCYELEEMGYLVWNITTDGFCTNAPEEVINKCKGFGYVDLFKSGLRNIDKNATTMWSLKHVQDLTFSGPTRCNIGFSLIEYAGHEEYFHTSNNILAKGGWKDTENYYERGIRPVMAEHKTAEKLLFEYYENEKGCEVLGERGQTNLRDLHYKGIEPCSIYKDRIVKMNMDCKRVPNIQEMEEVEVWYNGKTIKSTNFKTKPLEEIQEYYILKNKVDKTDHAIRTKEEITSIVLRNGNYKVNKEKGKKGSRKKGSSKATMVKDLMVVFRRGLISIPELEKEKRGDIIEIFNMSIEEEKDKININIWKNATRKSKEVEYSKEYLEALEKLKEEVIENYKKVYELPY